MLKSKRTRTRPSSIPVRQSNNAHNAQTQQTVYTTRSDSSDGEITTVRQSFKIIGSTDEDNRNSVESFCDSNKDSGYDGSQELLHDSGSDSFTEVKMIKTVSFEDVDTTNDSQIWAQPTNDIKLELEEEVGEDEEALKEELLRIFDRERLTLGSFFKHKMEDMTREFKNKQNQMEENSRAERAELENEIAQERAEMQKSFADEIAALTRTFNEERANLEQYYKEQLKELREQAAEKQNEMDQKITREKNEQQEKLEAEFQAMLRAEIADLKQSAVQEATEKEDRHNLEKLEMERKHNVELTEAEMNTQKVKTELETMFAQEKMRLESDLRGRISDLEAQLREEQEKRNELEKLLDQEKVYAKNLESEKRDENEKFKSELEVLRIELDEKNKSSVEMRKVEEEIRVKGKDGLNGRLREDFDRIVDDYKMELERDFQKEKDNLQREMEYQCQAEIKRLQEDLERERKRLDEDIAKEREDLENSRKRCQEEKEEKAKAEEKFSRENSLKYNENLSSSRGMLQNERMVNGQDFREFERERTSYRPSLNSSGESRDKYPSSAHYSENSIRYDTDTYPISCYEQPRSQKILIEYETTPSGIENNERNEPNKPNDFNKHFASEEDLLSSSFEVPDSKKEAYYVRPENENKLRSDMNELRRENEGLKAKIAAMEENIDLHRTYKAEVKEELSRLQKDKNELQLKLKDKDTEQDDDAIHARKKVDELERSFRESEAKRRDFEEKIKELNERLSEAENKSKAAKERVRELEDKLKKQPQASKAGSKDPSEMKKSIETCYTSPLYHEPSTSLQYDKKPESDRGGLPNNDSSFYSKPASQDNVYGYPSETKSKEYKLSPYQCRDTTTSNFGNDSYRSYLDGFDPAKCDYSDRFGSDTDYPRVTRPDLYSSHVMTSPLYGSHIDKNSRFGHKTDDKYKSGRYSSFEEKSDPYFETSSPRLPKSESRDRKSSTGFKDVMKAKTKDADYGKHPSSDETHDTHASHDHETNYEKAIVEREKLVQLIKELKEKVEELEKEKERIDNEEYKLIREQFGKLPSSNLQSENAALKLKVDEMQRKIKVLADRLKSEKAKNPFDDEGPRRKRYSMEEIEDLQGKLRRTGDVINGSHDNLDPDVLRRIEREIKSIGEFIRSHYYEESHGEPSYRSVNDVGKVLQLQMEKQELEMKLNMAKEVMNDYVSRLSDKMEDFQEGNCLSDSTLQELYDRNARLKETLKALEKGQHTSQIQNEQLKHQKTALQHLIGQLCKPSDVSFGSQFSSARQSGKDGNYGYTMTSQTNYKVPKLDFSDRYSS